MVTSVVCCLQCVQIGYKNQCVEERAPLTVEKAVSLVKDVFTAAAERDIYTGDGVVVHVITEAGTDEITVPLRRD